MTIDRRTACGGIFLDRGELERATDAEGQFNDERDGRDDDSDRSQDEHRDDRGRRRGGFLGDLLDFG